ncbi:MAG: hypothetical protein ABI478_11105 [Propionivibrio sp.]
MPNTTTGARRAKPSKSRVIKVLLREERRLERFIAKFGDLPIGTPDTIEPSPEFIAAIKGRAATSAKGGAQ